jgi:hypothetical protein
LYVWLYRIGLVPNLMNSQPMKVTFVRDHFPNQGGGYTSQEQAAFPLDQAVTLVARGIAVFSDPADLEASHGRIDDLVNLAIAILAPQSR